MPDLDAEWGGDLSVSATGDLTMVNDPLLGTRRVLRRLMTNPGDYIWNPTYGAGLAQFVGRPASISSIETLVRAQMALEASIAQTPEPVVSITENSGSSNLQIRYQDAITASSSSLQVNYIGS